MAAKVSKPTPVKHLKYKRFTTKQHGYQLLHISMSFGGNIAVSGLHNPSRQTFLDLYAKHYADCEYKLKLVYSKEFENYLEYKYRYVSCLNTTGSQLVTCIGNKVEVIDTQNGSKVLHSYVVNGDTRCLAVNEEEIFVGLWKSQTVLVFNCNLIEKKKIHLHKIQEGDWPWDFQVVKNSMFLCTAVFNEPLSLGLCDGSSALKYRDMTGFYSNARSIAVSDGLNLLTIVWGWRRIIVYSLKENKCLLVFDVDSKVHIVKISDRDKMVITGNYYTGEIKMYSLEHLFSYEAMKKTLAYLVTPEECENLRKYFMVTEEEIQRLQRNCEIESKNISKKEVTLKKMECLFDVIEEKRHLLLSNVKNLIDAVLTIGNQIRSTILMGPMEGYSLYSYKMKYSMRETITLQRSLGANKIQPGSKHEAAGKEFKNLGKERFASETEDDDNDDVSLLLAEADAFIKAVNHTSVQYQKEDRLSTDSITQKLQERKEDTISRWKEKHHDLYIEDYIGREGGIIQFTNVSLTVPPDALDEGHLIAISVINACPFYLDREVDTARMTPLIKLEPLGLLFKKPVQLNIPHSALIPHPEQHDVIIYSGRITKKTAVSVDCITWTEEKSIPRQLKEKSVTVDIQCLTYLTASLVSQKSGPQLYIVRAVPFVDRIRNKNDDIILTVCFCCDNDAVYDMLLLDCQPKLTLDQYSTLQLSRLSKRDTNEAGFLCVTVSSINHTYVPYNDQAMKKLPVSHLCTASRVSHQFRLRKKQSVDSDILNIVLSFSQKEMSSTKLFLKVRKKDLMTCQDKGSSILTDSLFKAFKPYEDLKASISSILENDHCIKLATFFDLTPAEIDKVKADATPGRVLMKILDEREMIMPQKMFGLHQGLKVCHLDKIARMVLGYIEKDANVFQQKRRKLKMDSSITGISGQTTVSKSPLSIQRTRRTDIDKAVQTILSLGCSDSRYLVEVVPRQEIHLDKNKTPSSSNIINYLLAPLRWVRQHPETPRYLMCMVVDGLLQTQRGIFTVRNFSYEEKESDREVNFLCPMTTFGNEFYQWMWVVLSIVKTIRFHEPAFINFAFQSKISDAPLWE